LGPKILWPNRPENFGSQSSCPVVYYSKIKRILPNVHANITPIDGYSLPDDQTTTTSILAIESIMVSSYLTTAGIWWWRSSRRCVILNMKITKDHIANVMLYENKLLIASKKYPILIVGDNDRFRNIIFIT
jgi:hypothetical protein